MTKNLFKTPIEKIKKIISKKHTHQPISAITAYDYPTARLADEAEVDIILVGDSLGMVSLGFPDTTHVKMSHMLHHLEACRRGVNNTLLVTDLPYGSYDNPDSAIKNSKKLMRAGADAVKAEGGLQRSAAISAICQAGIPFFGHIGMLPQSIREEGGYKKKGKTADGCKRLLEDADFLAKSGAFAIVLEGITAKTATSITKSLAQENTATIGIGAGVGTCNGEIAVLSDVIGAYPWFVPPFATPYADIANEISKAIKTYKNNIKIC